MIEPIWRKSSRCGVGSCVEVSTSPEGALVRDSEDRRSPLLAFGPGDWRAFLDGIRNGEFDHR